MLLIYPTIAYLLTLMMIVIHNRRMVAHHDQQGAEREIKEEIGISISIDSKLGENEYIANKPEKGKVVKHVSYFLAYADYIPLTLEHKEQKGGLDNAEWFESKDVSGLRIYDDIKPIITKAIDLAKIKKSNTP